MTKTARFSKWAAIDAVLAHPSTTSDTGGVGEVTDAMVDAYLRANDAYWKRTDELPTPPDKWRTGTPREATRVSLLAALAHQSAAGQSVGGGEVPGWKLVPTELTAEMADAAVQRICYGPEGGFTRTSGPRAAWKAMLAAAPQPQSQRAAVGEAVTAQLQRVKDAHLALADDHTSYGRNHERTMGTRVAFYMALDKLAALAAPAQPGEAQWLPIETAPKEGRILLGYAPTGDHEEGYVAEGRWWEGYADAPDDMGHDGGFMDSEFRFFRFPRSFGAEQYRTKGFQPTHWQPIPAAPTAPKGGATE